MCCELLRSSLFILIHTLIFSNLSLGEVSTCQSNQYLDTEGDCEECSTCPPGTEEVESCTNNNDTGCQPCTQGRYSSNGTGCILCSKCPPGTYISSPCNATFDTKCSLCPRDTYATSTNSKTCRPCGACYMHEQVIRSCNDTHDVVCGDCIKGYFKYPRRPRLCLRCSPCHNSSASMKIPACAKQTDDPNMQCMQGTYSYDALVKQNKQRKAMHTTSEASVSTLEQSTNSTPKTRYIEPSTIHINASIAIPIIVLVVMIIVFIITLVCWRKRFRKSKMTEERTVVGMNELVQEVRCIQIPRQEIPIVNCHECALHYGLEDDLEDVHKVDHHHSGQNAAYEDDESTPLKVISMAPQDRETGDDVFTSDSSDGDDIGTEMPMRNGSRLRIGKKSYGPMTKLEVDSGYHSAPVSPDASFNDSSSGIRRESGHLGYDGERKTASLSAPPSFKGYTNGVRRDSGYQASDRDIQPESTSTTSSFRDDVNDDFNLDRRKSGIGTIQAHIEQKTDPTILAPLKLHKDE